MHRAGFIFCEIYERSLVKYQRLKKNLKTCQLFALKGPSLFDEFFSPPKKRKKLNSSTFVSPTYIVVTEIDISKHC